MEKFLILLFVMAKVCSGSFECIEFHATGEKFVVDKGSNITIAFNISRECPPLLFITVFNRKGHQFEEYCIFRHKDGQCSSSSPSECACEHLHGPRYVITGKVSEAENVGMEWIIAGTSQSVKNIFTSRVNVTVRLAAEDTTTDEGDFQQSTSTQTSSSSTNDTGSSVSYTTPDSVLEEDKEGTTENPVTASVVTKAIVESETLDHTTILYTSMGVIVLLVVVVLVVFGIILYRKVLSVNHKLEASNRARVNEEPVREQVEMMELPPQPMGPNRGGVGNRISAFSIASDVYQTIEDSSTTDDNSQVGWSGTEFDSDPDITAPVVAAASAKVHIQETSFENDAKELARGNKGAKRSFENFSRDPTCNNESKELAYEIKDLLDREGEHGFDRGRRGIVFKNELSSSVDGVDVRPVGLRVVHHCKPPSGLPFDLGTSTSDYLNPTVSKVEKQASAMLKTEGAKHQAVLQEDQEISALTLNAGASSSDYLHPTFSKKEKQGRRAMLKNPVASQEDREIKAFALKSGGDASSQRVVGRKGISVAHPQYIPHPRPVAEQKKANVRFKLWTSTNPSVRDEGVGGVSMEYNPRQYPSQTCVAPSLSRSADNLLFLARSSAAGFAREFTHDTPLTYPNVQDVNTSRLDRYERKSLTSSVPELPTDSEGYLMPRQLFATPPRKPRAVVMMNKKSALQDASTNIAHKGLSLGVHKYFLDHPAKSQGPSKPPPAVKNKPQKFAVRSDTTDSYRSSQPRFDKVSASGNLSFNRKVQQEQLSKQTQGGRHMGMDTGHGASKQVESEYMNDELGETSEETADGYMRMNRLRVSVDIHKPYHCHSTDLEQQELDLALQTDPNTIHADHGVDSTPVASVPVFGEASSPHASVDQPYQNIDNL